MQGEEPDILLESNDTKYFKMHKVVLKCSSQMFCDMFEACSDEAAVEEDSEFPVIKMNESSAILHAVLPAFYNSWFDHAKRRSIVS